MVRQNDLKAVKLERERIRTFDEKYNINKLDYAAISNPIARKVICSYCGSTFGRKVWNFNDKRFRRIIWRCNKKYEVKGQKGCKNKQIDDKAFNIIIENKNYFIDMCKEGLKR